MPQESMYDVCASEVGCPEAEASPRTLRYHTSVTAITALKLGLSKSVADIRGPLEKTGMKGGHSAFTTPPCRYVPANNVLCPRSAPEI